MRGEGRIGGEGSGEGEERGRSGESLITTSMTYRLHPVL